MRWRVLFEAFANIGMAFTFRGSGLWSIADLTFKSAALASRAAWKVKELYSTDIKGELVLSPWMAKTFEEDKFFATLRPDISLIDTK